MFSRVESVLKKLATVACFCTRGSSPTAAVWLKEQIEGLLPEHTEEILTWLEGQRPILKERLPHQRERAACFARLFAACLELGRPLTEEERDHV